MAETAGASERRDRSPGKSLQRTLATWFSFIALISCLVVGALGTYLRAQGMREKLFKQLEVMRDDKVRAIRSWFVERLGDQRVLASERGVREFCRQRERGENPEASGVLSRLESFRVSFGYHAVFLAGVASGVTLVSTDPADSDSHRLSTTHLSSLLKQGKPIISDVFRDPIHQQPEMVVAGPVEVAETGEIVGILVFQIDPGTRLYDLLRQTERLGGTDEMVLVSRDRIVQTPLRHEPDAALSLKIDTEPARLGAEGKVGEMASVDYREVPVMAAYGHIQETGWGLVVKQDLAEINAPVWSMMRTMGAITLVALIVAVAVGLATARRIAGPAGGIAAVAERIGAGDMDARAEAVGPSEIRRVATSLNLMVERLASQVRIGGSLGAVYSAAGAHGRMSELLKAVVPIIADVTSSQVAVVYLAGENTAEFKRVFSHGIDEDRVAPLIHTAPRDHLLSRAAAACKVDVCTDIPEDHEIVIATQAGDFRPRSLLGIPLLQQEVSVGVIGLASIYDFTEEAVEIAETLSLNLTPAFLACQASERTEEMFLEVQAANDELTEMNQRLEMQSRELLAQSVELDAQRTSLEHADRLKSQFLSNMSHELRTPLNSVLALSQLMLARTPQRLAEEDAEHLEIIERNGRHLLGLLNDILDLAKIESGRMELFVSEFSLTAPLDHALETTEALAREKGLDLQVEVGDLPKMWSDADKIRQILLNLLSNAVKFTDRGGIEVEATSTPEWVSVAVRDTGAGISRNDLPHIFDEFTQVDGSSTRRHEGTGLGLAICQRLAGLLGGRIEAESEPGEGSTFTLVIPPICPRPSYPGVLVAGTAVGLSPASTALGPTILVADDDPTDRGRLMEVLVRAGYTVREAANGREALVMARRLRPAAITLDVVMPEMDGWEVLRELRADKDLSGIPVIVVSTADDRSTGLALGAAACFTKPIDEGLLLREIRQTLQGRAGRILVVEDSDVAALQIRSALEEHGYTVTVASGGAQAIESFEHALPDAVVLDLMMPDIDGFEVMKQIRSTDRTATLPILVLTSKDLTAEERGELAHNNIRELIQKGELDRDQLVERVAALVGPPVPLPPVSRPVSKTILVVEDNPDNMTTILAILKEMEAEFVTAEDGHQAIETAKQSRPGLILMDMQLPGLGGMDAARQIKSDPDIANIPIVAVTARAMKGDRESILRSGCDDYMSKPLDPALVAEMIRKWMG